MAIDPADLKRWANRASPKTPREVARAAPAARQAAVPSLQAPPPGYGYAIIGGVPKLVPEVASQQVALPVAAPIMAGQPRGSNVIPMRRSQGSKLVRPLSRGGVPVRDPYDDMMDSLPELAPETATMLGLQRDFAALTGEEEELRALPPQDGPESPDNPFGRRPLSSGASDLKR